MCPFGMLYAYTCGVGDLRRTPMVLCMHWTHIGVCWCCPMGCLYSPLSFGAQPKTILANIVFDCWAGGCFFLHDCIPLPSLALFMLLLICVVPQGGAVQTLELAHEFTEAVDVRFYSTKRHSVVLCLIFSNLIPCVKELRVLTRSRCLVPQLNLKTHIIRIAYAAEISG